MTDRNTTYPIEEPVTMQEGTGNIVDVEPMSEGNQVNPEPVLANNDPGTQAGGEVINDTIAAAQQNHHEPQVAGGVDPMAEDQSGYDAGQANALRNIEDGSLNPEYIRSNLEGGGPYVGGYVRGYDETIGADQAAKMAAPPTDMQPPLGPDNDLGPMGPGIDSGSPPGPGPMDPRPNLQTGGDGFRLGVDAEMVGGQAVVEGYDSEQHVCGGYGEELAPQEGGGSPFNFITDPDSGDVMSIFSKGGKNLLKRYIKAYKLMQSGGAALLEGVEPNATGALYDGVEGAGAEYMPDACGLTYDAQGDNWTHTQVGGGKKHKKRKSKRHSKKRKGRVMKQRSCGCDEDCKSCKIYGCDKDPRKCKCNAK